MSAHSAPITLANAQQPAFNKSIFDRAAKWLHDKKGYTPDMLTEPEPRALMGETYRVLHHAVETGQALSVHVPPELTAALQQNTFIFSGFKTHHELQQASLLLTDGSGGFKPFERYEQDVLKVHNTYDRQYLNAEYSYAVQATQMAVKWKEFEQDGDRYHLQYRTAGDEKVREEHAALNGTTLPMSDPFWDSYLPPLGWNCRCTAVQVLKDKYPQSDSAQAIEAGNAATQKPKQQIFRFNPGKTMKVFPPKHPYLPKGCGSCPYGNGNGNVDTGHALYLLSYNPANPQCQACMAIYKCISTFNDNEMKARLQSDLVKWYKSEMPEVMVGKFKARRFNVMFDGLETIINKNSYNEILNKGSHDELYAKRLVLAKKIHANSNKFRYQKGKDEAGIDHPDAIFKVFIGGIDGYNLKIKVKCNQDGNILWAMRII